MPVLLLLIALFFVFRIPPLLNARGLHSDAAVVGLQAMHLMKGEWTRFIWGANYQGVPEAALIAGLFSVGGISALNVMLVPMIGHLIVVILVHRILTPLLPRWSAFFLTLIVVLTPIGINMFGLYPPRQWSITVLFLAIAWINAAGRLKWSGLHYLGACALAASSLYLDLFALQFMPAFAVLALGCCWDDEGEARATSAVRAQRLLFSTIGAGVGYFLALFLRQSAISESGAASLNPAYASANWSILKEFALPWILGYRVFIPGAHLYPDLWVPPAPVQAFQWLGGFSLLAGIVAGGALCFSPSIPWRLRRLGAFGFLAAAASFGGFFFSPKVQDMWAVRFLAPIIWMAPFALAPLAFRMRRTKGYLLLVPYLVVAAMGGWLSYGPYVNGIVPVRSPRGLAEDERKLGEYLRAQGIRFAGAQYWLAYRLTFLFGENPVVTPFNDGESRYAPYADGFASAPRRAFIFHPSEPRARAEDYLRLLNANSPGKVTQTEVSGFTVLIQSQ